jgi:hypothetical protein
VAAAAWDNSDHAIKEVQKKLSRLRARCRSPANLESSIGDARREARELAVSVRAYQRTAQPEARRATDAMMQNIEDRLEAVNSYAHTRGHHSDADHVIGRVSVVQFARAAVDEMINYFNAI